jgi:PAS domain S-box-containing protein
LQTFKAFIFFILLLHKAVFLLFYLHSFKKPALAKTIFRTLPICANILNEDITYLQQSAGFFTAVMGMVDSLVVVLNTDGNIIGFNKAAEKTTGYTFAEVKNKAFADIFLTEPEKTVENPLNQFLKEESQGQQKYCRTKTGEPKLISWHNKLFQEGNEPSQIICTGTDITSQIEAQRIINDSNQRIKTVFNNAPDAIIVLNNIGEIIEWNPKAERIFGWKAVEVVGKDLGNILVPESSRKAHDIGFARFNKTGEGKLINRQLDLCALHKDGHEIDISLSISPSTKQGKYIFIGFVRDISEHKKAELTLMQRTQQLDEAQHIAHIGSWEWDIAKNKVLWSDELYNIFGLQRNTTDVALQEYLEVIHPEEKDAVAKKIQYAINNHKPFSYNHRILRNDGTERYIFSKGNVITDSTGKPLRMYGIAQDVTEFHSREEALQFTQFSVDMASDAVFWVQEDARFVYVNEAACTMFGYTREELLIMHVYDLEVSPNGKNNWPKFWDFIKTSKTALVESKVRRKDGSIFPLEINTSYFKYRDKEIKVSYARDISERKRTEQDIKNVNHDLSTFIYRSTHDLKAPVASITGLVNLAKAEVMERNARHYLKLIGECTHKLDNVLLTLIQAMAVKDNKIHPGWLNFNKIVYNILNTLKYMRRYTEIEFDVDIEVDKFYSDEGLITSIMQNIIENAIKYQKEDSAAPEIKIYIKQQEDSSVHITVSDNGNGIDEKFQDKVFDIFYRATNAIKGSGLGLYIVKNAVFKLGGEIKLQSKLNEGTTMFIVIPPVPQPGEN